MALLFSNNASAELAAALAVEDTILYVEEGKGSYFPVLSTEGDYFYVTLVGDSVMEIVKVTATEGDTFTIVRAQDNTEAASFAIGDLIELRITAAAFKDINTSFSTLDNNINEAKASAISAQNTANTALTFMPVGAVIAFAANSDPSGFLLCNGAEISRTTYAALFTAIGTTYGIGDDSTTFNLPDLTDRFIQGSGTAGTVKAAGLPNITGEVTGLRWQDANTAGGAFALNTNDGGTGFVEGSNGPIAFDFNASRSSAIYGNSTTVQPPTLTMRFYIKY